MKPSDDRLKVTDDKLYKVLRIIATELAVILGIIIISLLVYK